MNDRVYIVLYEGYADVYAMPGKRWIYDGLFDTKAAAEDYIEQQKKEYESLRWAIVEGPICEVESMREAETRLGKF